MEVRRLNPEEGFIREFNEYRNRVKSLETKPAGNITIRESLTTTDPNTGVSTIIGALPDGSYGFEQFIGDIEPPPVATAPTVKAQPGVFVVWWDGNLTGPKPRDFVHVNIIGRKVVSGVAQAPVNVGVIRTGTESVFVSTDVAAVGEVWRFTLQSEDYNGNVAAEGTAAADITMQSAVTDAGINAALIGINTDIVSASNKAVSAQNTANTAQSAADAAATKADAAIASGASLVVNGDFEAAGGIGWPTLVGTSIEASTGTARSGTKVLRCTLGSGARYAYSSYITGATNRTYYVEYYVRLRETLVAGNESLLMGAFFSYITSNGTSSAAATYGTGYGGVPLAMGDLSTTVWKKVATSYTFTTDDITSVRFAPRIPGSTALGNTVEIDDFKVIDVTEAALAQTKADQAFNSAVSASSAAGSAQSTADSKNRSWNQTSPPPGTGHKEGDLWFDTDDGNKLYLWKTSTNTWTPFQDGAIAALQTSVSAVTQTANGKNTIYYQGTQPSGGTYTKGDLWFDTANSYKLYTYTGSAWQATQDAAGALSIAQGKNNSFLSGTAPTASAVGDLWIDTANGNQMKRWNGTAWVDARDTTIATAQAAATGAQATANGKNTVYYQGTAPSGGTYRTGDVWFDTANSYRMSTWTGSAWQLTQDSKAARDLAATKNQTFIQGTAPTASAAGDIWIDTSNQNQLKRWSGSAWVDARDASIATAASAAASAQSTANGKNTVFYSATQPSTTNRVTGDTWFDTANGYRVSVWNGSAWTLSTFGTNAIANAAITNALIADATIQAAKIGSINADVISTGTLAAARIAAASIGVDKLVVGQGQNLAYNGAAETGSSIGYTGFIRATATPPTGFNAYWTTTTGQGTTTFLNQPAVKVKPNTQYRVSVWVMADKAGSKTYLEPQTGSIVAGERTTPIYAFSNLDVPTVWTRWTSVITTGTAPSNTLTFRWFVNHTNGTTTDSVFSFTGFELYEMNTGELIVDGAITAGSAIIANGAIGTAQIGDAQITAAKILDANITTAKIADLAVTDAKISSINAGKIVASWLTAGVINAGAITTSMLAVSDITNFAPSYAESPNDWVMDAGISNIATAIAAATDKRRFSFVDNSGAAKLARGPLQSVQPGDELYAEGTIYRTGVTTNAINLRYYFYDNTKAYLSSASLTLSGNTTPQNSPNAFFQQIKAVVPSGAFYARLALVMTNSTNDDIGMYNIRGYRRFGGQLIVDGAIQAGSAIIGTGAIGTAQIADLAVTNAKVIALDAGKMTTGLLDAARIDVGTISADKLVTGIGNNLVADPNFNNATLQARRKTISDSATAGTWTVDPANQLVSLTVGPTPGQLQWRLREAGSGSAAAPYPIDSGRKYNITFDVFRPTGTTPLIRSNIYYKKQDGTFSYVTDGMSNVTPPTQNAWNTVNRVWTPPADAVAFGVDLVVSTTSGMAGLQFRSPSVRAMSNATVIEDGAIVTQHMTVGTIDGSVMSVNSISGSQLKFKTITADRLVISSTDNLVVEADFSNGGSSWGTLNANKVIISNAGRGSGPALRVTGSTALQTVTNLVNKVPVGSEDRFRGSFYVKSSAAASAGAYKLRMNQYTTASTSTTATIATSPALTAGTWTLVEGYSPALPVGTIAIEFFLEATNAATGTTTDFDYVAVTRAADGRLVVDGAIDGKVITGATFQTSNTVAASGGLIIDVLGLRAHNPVGTQTFKIDALTGIVTSTGRYSTQTEQVSGVAGGGTMTIGATFGNFTYNTSTDFSGIPGIEFTRVHSSQGAKPPARIFYDGSRVITTTWTDANAFVPNVSGGQSTIGEGEISLSTSRNGATQTATESIPTANLWMSVPVTSPGDEYADLHLSYRPDGYVRKAGFLAVAGPPSGYSNYAGAGRYTAALVHENQARVAGRWGKSQMAVADNGLWMITGQRNSDGAYVTMVNSQGDASGVSTGVLGLHAINKVSIGNSFGSSGLIEVTGTGTTIYNALKVTDSVDLDMSLNVDGTTTLQGTFTASGTVNLPNAITNIGGTAANWGGITKTGITFAGGGIYSNYAGFANATYWRDPVRVSLAGVVGVNVANVTIAAGNTYTIGSIPSAYAPDSDILFSPLVGATMNANIVFYVRSNGTLQYYSPTTQTLTQANFYIGLDGMNWLRKA